MDAKAQNVSDTNNYFSKIHVSRAQFYLIREGEKKNLKIPIVSYVFKTCSKMKVIMPLEDQHKTPATIKKAKNNSPMTKPAYSNLKIIFNIGKNQLSIESTDSRKAPGTTRLVLLFLIGIMVIVNFLDLFCFVRP